MTGSPISAVPVQSSSRLVCLESRGRWKRLGEHRDLSRRAPTPTPSIAFAWRSAFAHTFGGLLPPGIADDIDSCPRSSRPCYYWPWPFPRRPSRLHTRQTWRKVRRSSPPRFAVFSKNTASVAMEARRPSRDSTSSPARACSREATKASRWSPVIWTKAFSIKPSRTSTRTSRCRPKNQSFPPMRSLRSRSGSSLERPMTVPSLRNRATRKGPCR